MSVEHNTVDGTAARRCTAGPGEIIEVSPMPPPALHEALHLRPEESVVAYSIWGGVPRNWELAADYDSTRRGCCRADPGPQRRTAWGTTSHPPGRHAQPRPVQLLVGVDRRRLPSPQRDRQPHGQPATNLSRPLSRLIDLGYVRRELPFGESTRSTKRSLDRLDDPFLLFWYRFAVDGRPRQRSGAGSRGSTARAGTRLSARCR